MSYSFEIQFGTDSSLLIDTLI